MCGCNGYCDGYIACYSKCIMLKCDSCSIGYDDLKKICRDCEINPKNRLSTKSWVDSERDWIDRE